jgi:hypothetical protein
LLAPTKAEGVVKLQVSEEEGLRLRMQYSNDSYGVSPTRVENNFFENDHQGESLRAPHLMNRFNMNINSPMVQQNERPSRGTLPASTAVVPVLDLLNQQESLDIRFIQAEQYFNDQNF